MRTNSLGFSTLAVLLGPGTLAAQFNPNGWIQTDGWNYLMPLTQDSGCGGSETNMLRNWIAPHVIALEDPKTGTSWSTDSGEHARIDFGSTAASTGWGGGALAAHPTWVTNDFLEASYPNLGLSMPNGDAVDYQSILDYLNWKLVSTLPGPPPDLPGDDVLGIATTYVRNTTGVGLEVEVCMASDDGGQVWMNDVLVGSDIGCRGNMHCDPYKAILPPGLSKIAILVWEAGGGWSFRLGIRMGGILISDPAAAAAGLEFIGPGGAGEAGQSQYQIVRSFLSPAFPCPSKDPVQVCLQGSGPGADGDPILVDETVLAASPADITFSSVPAGATVSDVLPRTAPAPSPVGVFGDRRVIGNDCGLASTTNFIADTYTSVSTTGGEIWDGGDDFEFAYNRMSGDFDISIEFTSRVHPSGAGRWGRFGLMARANRERCSRSTMIQDHLPNPIDTTRVSGRTDPAGCNSMYEVPVNGVAESSFHPAFIRLTRRGNVFQGWYSETQPADPAVDANWIAAHADDWGGSAPAEVFVGFANSDHNSDGCLPQSVGFELLHLSGATRPVNGVPAPIGKSITIPTTRGALNEGTLCYSVQYDGEGGISISGIAPSVAVVQGPHSACCEDSAESVTIVGPNEGFTGTPVDLFADAGGLDGAATFTWSIDSGPGTLVPDGSSATVRSAWPDGEVRVKVIVDDGVCGSSGEDTHTIWFGHYDYIQRPNDMNGDGRLDISDPVAILNHLFVGGVLPPCGENTIAHPATLALLDANGSGGIDISDPLYVLGFIFLGGPRPVNCPDDTCPCIGIVDCPVGVSCFD